MYELNIVNARKRYVSNFNNYNGVDLTSTIYNCNDLRATHILNLLNKNGRLQTRDKIENVFNANEHINGVWSFVADDKLKHTIAHIGNNFFEIKGLGKGNDFFDVSIQEIPIIGTPIIKNQSSNAFVGGNCLYILCGSYLILRHSENGLCISKVYENEITYIPTTTRGITYDGSQLEFRFGLDDVNMLTRYRRNSLYSGKNEIVQTPPSTKKYSLDALISYEELDFNTTSFDEKVTITIKYKTIDSKTNGEIYNTLVLKNYYQPMTMESQEPVYAQRLFPQGLTYEQRTTTFENQYGKIENNNELGVAILTLYRDYVPTQYKVDNIIVEFPNQPSEDLEAKIDKCTFGILYGCNGNRNRLFISGNPDYPNYDFHSTERNYLTEPTIITKTEGDFTYFSDLDFCAYGTSNSAIKGYEILPNGALCILKEQTYNEPTIYFRKGTYVEAINYMGVKVKDNDEPLYEELFPVESGNIGEGCVAPETMKFFDKEVVFLSNRGLYGISLSNNVSSNERYSFCRSKAINNELCKYDLSQAKCFIFNNCYFLSVNKTSADGKIIYKCFVADGRFRYQYNDESYSNEFQYEWFILDNIEATSWFVFDDELYFTNLKNQICKFTDSANGCFDVDYRLIGNGGIGMISPYETSLYFSKAYDNFIKKGTQLNITFSSDSPVYCKLADGTLHSSNLCTTKNQHFHIINNQEIYIFTKNHEYIGNYVIAETEDTNGFFLTKNGQVITINDIGIKEFDLYIKADEPTLYVKSIYSFDDNTRFFSVVGNDSENEVIFLNYSAIKTFGGLLTNKTPIISIFMTKAYDFGNTIYSKNLLSISLINDSPINSNVMFGIKTKHFSKFFDKSPYNEGLDLDDVNFQSISFEDDKFVKTKAINYKVRNFEFIQFIFYNNIGSNLCLSNLSILYNFGFKRKGV